MRENIICHLSNFSPEYSGTYVDSLVSLARNCRATIGVEILCVFPYQARSRGWLQRFDDEGILYGFIPRQRNIVFPLRSLLRDYNPLIFHTVFDLFDIASVLMKFFFYKNSKVVWHLQNTASLSATQTIRDFVKVRLLGQQLVDGVITVGDGVYSNAKERGFFDKQLALVPNAVDITRFSRKKETRKQLRQFLGVSEKKLICLLLGWDPHRKGVDLFLKAAAEVSREGSADFLFLIIGREETRQFVSNFDESRRLGTALRIIDPVEDFSAFLNGIDVLVLASRNEGLSYTVLEAMAAHKIILSSEIAGAREDYGGSRGVWLYPVQEWRQLSALMKRAGELSFKDRQILGEANYIYVQARYSLEQWTQKILEIYTRLIEA
jgi:glycosyltransferase involved in cell wall biosynthesis